MIKNIPRPISGGIILSYKCSAECRHCIYACSQKWNPDWISKSDLEIILSRLSGKIISSPYGPNRISLNYGLHFTGGEPFLNFDLLCTAVEIADKLKIPSIFVETNCFWASDDNITKEKLKLLKKKGLKGIMISVNPFYLEFIPFDRTERAIKWSLDIFGHNTIVYQIEYYRRFKEWGIKDKVSFEEYVRLERREDFLKNVEFLMMGRAPYRLNNILRNFFKKYPAETFFNEECITSFLTSFHNHFDNYRNFIPGFCGGISLGDCKELDHLIQIGIETEYYPILGFLIDNNFEEFLNFAKDYGYVESEDGYFSKCHLCIDIRRYLIQKGDFKELKPREFYEHLD